MTPTQRAIKLLKAEGWYVAKVETWNPWAKVRNDLFGMFDLLAMKTGQLAGVQVTSGSNHAARVNKLAACDMLPVWLSTGQGAWVMSFRKSARTKKVEMRKTDMGEQA